MKSTKMILTFATLALGIASAAATSYDVKFTGPTKIGGTELKAGDYKLELQGEKAIFKMGKTVVEVPATVSTNEKKFSSTSLSISDSKLKEIDLAGTKSKVMFSADAPVAKGN